MIEIEIPGFKKLMIENIVFDYNGTLAIDGVPVDNSIEYLLELNSKLNINVLTADTFKTAGKFIPKEFQLKILNNKNQEIQKSDFVKSLGKEKTIAVGNGFNDHIMLDTAVIGVAIIQKEGAAIQACNAADLVYLNVVDFIQSLLNIKRLVASLRR